MSVNGTGAKPSAPMEPKDIAPGMTVRLVERKGGYTMLVLKADEDFIHGTIIAGSAHYTSDGGHDEGAGAEVSARRSLIAAAWRAEP